jgi:Limonene-1,2-epoxide hydrolase catalytic domain
MIKVLVAATENFTRGDGTLQVCLRPSIAFPRPCSSREFKYTLENSIPTWKMRLMSFIDLDVLAIAAHGNIVFTERVDRFRWQGKRLDLPVAGVFEISVGKIIAHRDYFDYETWRRATGIPLA